jgi:type II secretory pathway pseudopilin PulG
MKLRPMRRGQRGITLVALLVVLGIAGVLLAARLAESMAVQDRAQKELVTMGKIRDALVSRAATDESRPGSLPCPDTDNDGVADGSSCAYPYVGRVPWKTLGLPEPRDSSGELFWYAIASPYRDTSSAGTLNSDTAGTITVNGSGGAPTTTDVVAVVIAPRGPVAGQTRDLSNAATLLARTNYLEGENATSPFGGDTLFEQGAVSDTFNDFAMPITRAILMPAVERRVARQARACLVDYAASAGRYPYAAPMWDTSGYDEDWGELYGRIPRTLNFGSWPDDRVQIPTVGTSWTGTERCFGTSLWWDYWRELLLYRVASPYTASPSGSCPGSCLYVNGSSSVEAVVIVAGRALNPNPINQTPRIANSWPKDQPPYYLESASAINNAAGLSSSRTFVRAGMASDFNDRLECTGPSPICD